MSGLHLLDSCNNISRRIEENEGDQMEEDVSCGDNPKFIMIDHDPCMDDTCMNDHDMNVYPFCTLY
jgi:hypothetical protein